MKKRMGRRRDFDDFMLLLSGIVVILGWCWFLQINVVNGMYTKSPGEFSYDLSPIRNMLPGKIPIMNEAASLGQMRSLSSLIREPLYMSKSTNNLEKSNKDNGDDNDNPSNTFESSPSTFRLSDHFQILRDSKTNQSQWFISVKNSSNEFSSQLLARKFGETNVHSLGTPYYRILAKEKDLEEFLVSSSLSEYQRQGEKEETKIIEGLHHVDIHYKLDTNLFTSKSSSDGSSSSNAVGNLSETSWWRSSSLTKNKKTVLRHWKWNGENRYFSIPMTPSNMETTKQEVVEEPFQIVIGLMGHPDDIKDLLWKWNQYYNTSHSSNRTIKFIMMQGLNQTIVTVEMASGWTVEEIIEFSKILAAEPQVYWIGKRSVHVSSNYFASNIGEGLGVSERIIDKHGLTGKNMIVACVDTGIVASHAFFSSQNSSSPMYILNTDLKSRPPQTNHKIATYIYSTESDRSDTFGGHGTHVSGTLAGLPNDTMTIYPYRGVAHDAQLVFFDIFNGAYNHDYLDIPYDMVNDLYTKTYLAGARVHSNSWGSADHGYNLASSYQVDSFMYIYKDALLVFAVGNDGLGGQGTANEPASAKNVIAVGATGSSMGPILSIVTPNHQTLSGPLLPSAFGLPIAQNPVMGEFYNVRDVNLCTSTSPSLAGKIVIVQSASCDFVQLAKNAQTSRAAALLVVIPDQLVGALVPGKSVDASSIQIVVAGLFDEEYSSFPQAFEDGVFASIQQTYNNINNVAFFSSRGPTYDGRIKPDVVAPGDMLLSSLAAPDYVFQKGLFALQGTSMSAPIVSGLALLLQEYFQAGYYPSGSANSANAINPSGFLLKAMLVNSARRMNGIVYLSETLSSYAPLTEERYPFIYQGHGRVNISNVMYFANTSFQLFINEASLSTSQRHSYQVNMTVGQQLAVTFAYNDPPAMSGSSSALINVLYLIVLTPSGEAYLGNNYDGSLSSPDLKNNLQKVIFKAPKSGIYTIQVVAHSVPVNSPQSYAMVYTLGYFDDQGSFGQSVPSSASGDQWKISLFAVVLCLFVSLWLIS